MNGAGKLVPTGVDLFGVPTFDTIYKIPTSTPGAVRLTLQDDGNAVIYNDKNKDLWATDTRQDVVPTDEKWRWWTELHNSVWKTTVSESGVAALVPVSLSAKTASGNVEFQDGVIVGLGNGALEQWSGGGNRLAEFASNWTEIASAVEDVKNWAAEVLGRKEDLAWSPEEWRLTQKGALQEAVQFVKDLWNKGEDTKWQSPGGIGTASDPIFGNALLQAGSSVPGRYIPFAYYNVANPDSLNYLAPKPWVFRGHLDFGIVEPGLQGPILYVVKDSIKEANNYADTLSGFSAADLVAAVDAALDESGESGGRMVPEKFESGWLLERTSGSAGQRIQSDTRIKGYLGEVVENGVRYDTYRVSGGLEQYTGTQDFGMKISTTPSFKAGVGIPFATYGYAYVPDGFVPKFTTANWSFGLLGAVGVGIGATANLGDGSITLKEKKFEAEGYWVTPIGPVALDLGAKLAATLKFNGVPEKLLNVGGYYYGGALFTYNTKGISSATHGDFQFAANAYLDVDFSDIKSVIDGFSRGLSITTTATPFLTLSYGLMIPKAIKFIGGWSLAKASLGLEAPGALTVCVDFKQSCFNDAAAGSFAAQLTWKAQLKAHVGVLEAFTGVLSYTFTKPLWSMDPKVWPIPWKCTIPGTICAPTS